MPIVTRPPGGNILKYPTNLPAYHPPTQAALDDGGSPPPTSPAQRSSNLNPSLAFQATNNRLYTTHRLPHPAGSVPADAVPVPTFPRARRRQEVGSAAEPARGHRLPRPPDGKPPDTYLPWGRGAHQAMFPPVDHATLQNNPGFAALYTTLTTAVLRPDGATKNDAAASHRTTTREVCSFISVHLSINP